MGLCHMNPMEFLETKDRTKLIVMRAVSRRMNELRAEAVEEAKRG